MNDSILYVSFIADTTSALISTRYETGGYLEYPRWKVIKIYSGNVCNNGTNIWTLDNFDVIDSIFIATVTGLTSGSLYTIEFKRKYNPDTCNNCNSLAKYKMSIRNQTYIEPDHLHECTDPCQLNCNGDFASLDLPCLPFQLENEFACNNACWQNGNISPQLYPTYSLVPLVIPQYAAMWSKDASCEAIVTTLNEPIIAGETYYGYFDFKSEVNPLMQFNLTACNSFTQNSNACIQFAPNHLTFYSQMPIQNNTTFTRNEFCFTNTMLSDYFMVAVNPIPDVDPDIQCWAYFDNFFISRLVNAGCDEAICTNIYNINDAGCPIPNATYSWTSTGVGVTFSNPNVMNPTVTFPPNFTNAPIDYFLTLTVTAMVNGIPCTDNDEVKIRVRPHSTLVGTSFTACNTTPIIVEVDNCFANLGYTWTVIPNDPGNFPTINPVGNCSLEVTCVNGFGATIIVNNGFCEDTFYIQDCCTGKPPAGSFPLYFTDVTATDLITHFGTSNITYPDGIYINGTLTIDQSLSFVGCPHIIMGPAAEIIIDNNNTLFIGTCNLSACDKMWYGIRVIDGQLTMQQSTVSDAQYAVHAYDGAITFLRQNNFYNNFISFYMAPNAIPQTNLGFIVSNNFATTANLVLPYLGQQPDINAAGFAGIVAHDVVYLQVGHTNAAIQKNTFTNLNCGILTYNTNCYIVNNLFENIIEQGGLPTYYGLTNTSLFNHLQTAVYCQGQEFHGVSLEGDISNDMEFDDCFRSIYLNGISGEIYNNLSGSTSALGNNRLGIVLSNMNDLAAVSIYENSLTETQFGMRIEECTGMIRVNNNEVFIENPVGNNFLRTGILVQNALPGITNTTIKSNLITMTDARRGIRLNTISNASVTDNHIFMGANHATPDLGIALEASDANTVSCNSVEGVGFSTAGTAYVPLSIAYDFQTSANNIVSCNTSNNTDVGFRFLNNCDNTDFNSNEINEHWQGLRLRAQPNMGPQFDQGNHWNFLNNYTGLGAHLLPLTNVTAADNLFKVLHYPTQGIFIEAPTHNVVFNLDWFDLSTVPQASCNVSLCELPIREDDDDIDEFELKIADGTATLEEFEPQTLFEMKKALNKKLELYPDLKTANTILTDFYNTTEAGTIGGLKEVKKTLVQKTAGEVTLETTIKNEQTTSATKFIDAKAAMDAITNATVILQSDIDAYLLACTVLKVSQSTANESSVQLAVIDKTKTEIASDQNNNVQANEVHEANLKTVNAIAIKYKLYSQLSEDDKNILYDIAVQCPFTGGVGVYQARAIISYFYDDMGYNDEATCMLDGYSMRKANTTNSEINLPLTIVPNPAKNYFEINAGGISLKNKMLKIFDGYGNIIKTVNMANETNNRISTEELSNGIYFVAIADGALQHYQKLVIVK